MEAQPASHPDSNFTDVESVSLVKYLLARHKRVIANIASVDKWPNSDGRVEIQDEQKNLIGPLSVQVKTLAANHNFKYNCEVDFLFLFRLTTSRPGLGKAASQSPGG